jgi:Predicted ornithine cyclodeaminase, mu-crystallin homolog
VIVLSQREVTALLPMRDCIEVMGRALAAVARGEAILPLRTVFRLPNEKNFFGLMPAFVPSPDSLGAKIITVFPGNHGTHLDSHQGAVLLFDTTTGSLQAMLDATAITSIRTAAVSALATRHLARDDADDLAIIGSGVQARSHLEAIPLVRRIRRVRVWSRDSGRAKAFAKSMSALCEVEVMPTARDAVRDASIICTVTSSREPVLNGEWVAPGAHVNAVGASTPQARELDTALVARSRIFVDRRESALKEPGDLLVPMSEGAITPDHIVAELGETVAGMRRGRESREENTLFKSLGLAVEDVAAARYAYDEAVRRSMGTTIDLGGKRNDGA